jgi:hypothetical protein
MSLIVCRARKTLPCQQNHFSRCSCVPISLGRPAAGSPGDSRSGRGEWQALGHAGHDGDPHRQVEPARQVPGPGAEVAGNVADVFAAVGEEGDLLAGGHPLGFEHSNRRRLGLVSQACTYPKQAGRPLAGTALPAMTSNQPPVRDRCWLEWT